MLKKLIPLTTLITITSSYSPFQDALRYNKIYELDISKDTKTTSFKFLYENERIYLKNITHYVLLNFKNYALGEHIRNALTFKIEGRNNDADVRNYFDSDLLSLGKDTDKLLKEDYSSHWIFNENFFVVPLNLFKFWDFSIDVDPKLFANEDLLKKKIEMGIGIFSEENIEVQPNFVIPGYLSGQTEGMVITIPKRKYIEGNKNILEISVCRGLLGKIAVIGLDNKGNRRTVYEKSEFDSGYVRLDINFAEETEMVLVKVSKKYRGEELFLKTVYRSLEKRHVAVYGEEGGKSRQSIEYDDLSYSYMKVRRQFGADVRIQRNEVYQINGVKETHSSADDVYDSRVTRVYAFDDKDDAHFSSVCGYHPRVFSHYLNLNESSKQIQSFSSIQEGYSSARLPNPGSKPPKAIIVDMRGDKIVKKRKNDFSQNLIGFKKGAFLFSKTLAVYNRDHPGLGIKVESSPVTHLGSPLSNSSPAFGNYLLFFFIYPTLALLLCFYARKFMANRGNQIEKRQERNTAVREIEITSSSSNGKSGFSSLGMQENSIDNTLQDESEDDEEFSSDEETEEDSF